MRAMRFYRVFRPFFTFVAVVTVVAASGLLECSRPRTPVEARGARTYAQMCAVCHGRVGEGYAADHAPALGNPDFLASASDEFLRRAIENGRSGSTMSAWSRSRGGPLSWQEIDNIVTFIRTWGPRKRVNLDEQSLHGDAANGSAAFARECASCHGAQGVGSTFVQVGNAELLSTASNGFLRYAIRRGRASVGMPSFEDKLGDGVIDDVVAHLRSLQAATPQFHKVAASAKAPPLPLGPVPLNPHGPEPLGFRLTPLTTPADTIKKELDRGAKMVILDARAPSSYTDEHIAGAVSVPFYDPSPYFDKLPRDAWLVCYCACPHAESGQLAQKLMAAGFPHVTVLDEGLGVWRSRKYPLQTGP